MIEVSDTVHVEADPRRVFEYLDDPHNHIEITPSLVSVRDVEPLDNGGKRASFTYGIAGVKTEGDLVETTHNPDERMAFELRGALSGRIEIEIEPANGGARVTYAAEYDVPGRVLERVAEPFVRRYNERELDTLLANLRSRLEANE